MAAVVETRSRARLVAPMRSDPPPVQRSDHLHELRANGLTVRFGDGDGVEGVDVRIRSGELVVVTGPIGSGKTTLLRALLGLVPASGTVTWNGHELHDRSLELVPPRCAYVPQVPRLFSERLADAVLLGADPRHLLDAIRLACLDEDLADMADGLDTLVGPRGVRLSGGQVQRTGAARALVRDPELLVIDDLSSALDVETETRLWDGLLSTRRASMLVVSHRAALLQRADVVVELDAGRLVTAANASVRS
jgi:ATP-binding cassette subfamily B protein